VERVKEGDVNQLEQTEIDPREFRRALGRFASGVTVITTEHEGQAHGMTANAFVSVSLDPPLVLVSVDNRARLHGILPRSGRYGVSVLSAGQEDLSRHFAGRPQPGLEVPFVWRGGIPLLEGALAHLVCRVVDEHPTGDHTLYIGLVECLAQREGAPLLFYTGEYRCLEVQIHSLYELLDHPFVW